MQTDPTDGNDAEALDRGRGFVDLSDHPKTRFAGGDALGWLNDLVTSEVDALAPGRSQRSLLLSPTGGIRADLTLAMDTDGSLLSLQAPDAPRTIRELLAPYVLSSDVMLGDATDELAWFALPGGPVDGVAGASIGPSALGGGVDVVAPSEDAERVRVALRGHGLVEAGPKAAEMRRIRRGDPRLGVDFEVGALPQEAGLDAAVDTAKGCFLGQESVARVRNLGHARTVLRHVRCAGALSAGDEVLAGGAAAGRVTSAAPGASGGTIAIVRLRWDAGEGPWTTTEGLAIERLRRRD